MGVFDTVECLYPLPEGYEHLQNDKFQTKCLYKTLDNYTINRKGQLIHHRVRSEEVPEEERTYYGTEKWDVPTLNFMYRTTGSMKTVAIDDHDEEWHGDINIYTHRGEHSDGTFEWFEFTVSFAEGKVEWIKRKEDV